MVRSAVSVAWIKFGGLGAVWRRGRGPLGPFASVGSVVMGVPSPGPPPRLPLAGARSPVLCFRCASINHHGLRASPLLGLWEGRWACDRTAEELTWQCPPARMVPKAVTNLAAGSGAQKAEPHLQCGRDFGGHSELSYTLQKGKLRPLKGEPI